MSTLPLNDWQFWVVTIIAAAAVGFGFWRVARSVRRSLSKKKETSVSLTVEREKPRKTK